MPLKVKIALKSKDVLQLIKATINNDQAEVASLMAISRLFLLRVPSELLKIRANHVNFESRKKRATVGPLPRKAHRQGSFIRRTCVCDPAARPHPLCGACALRRLRSSLFMTHLHPLRS